MLTPAFFDRDPVLVARELLGAHLVRVVPDGVMVARVVETEAYDCPRDPACYVLKRLAGASELMGGPAGRYYLHRAYEHLLLNVTCAPEGREAAVLIRAAEPLAGADLMRMYRPVRRDVDLTNGPAKLMTALHITPDYQGEAVTHPTLHFVAGASVPDADVRVTSRVGLKRGAHLPWRFLLDGHAFVSPGKPSMDL
ncbi:DNA-3-methyladenine glycosylase [Deinococcus maricopensis]|uniref:Putative 3-methyladenine DNA glycosylase n=1 Tax=Deinococcus maricopensis (strain DSM 21211 / LMG 22137 / NRRL B-23946 / LB-34) TaxID=709986 RepID=E8U6U8_DEIML|nr:DNA-3-methyladenine glycosylase [Deinococcus maricopensis]ADV66787.1 3-methyladenine DNA glycosylase [Deinococcus maricopensis DSM 21211]